MFVFTHAEPHSRIPLPVHAEAIWHVPDTQACPPVHALPGAPQFIGFDSRSTQLPPTMVSPGLQTQLPATHTSPVPHWCPIVPQLRGSNATFTHWPPDIIVPAGHAH